jgi:hypothetical protein
MMTHLKQVMNGFAAATVVVLGWTWALVRLCTHAFGRRPRPTLQDQLEAERLDRLRNPSKYLGK